MQAAVVCLVGALLALVIKRGNPEAALLLTLSAAVAVLLSLAGSLEVLLDFLNQLVEESGLSRDLFLPLYKTVGIALVVNIGGGLCRDAGESALGSVVETVGAVCALLAALPLLRAVLSLLLELMQ
ncbi:MAG: stage III sporulation protein AD [Oscillibacter sp.]|nr:stage III sporulation protein AD [Oscillibacter sp.]